MMSSTAAYSGWKSKKSTKPTLHQALRGIKFKELAPKQYNEDSPRISEARMCVCIYIYINIQRGINKLTFALLATHCSRDGNYWMDRWLPEDEAYCFFFVSQVCIGVSSHFLLKHLNAWGNFSYPLRYRGNSTPAPSRAFWWGTSQPGTGTGPQGPAKRCLFNWMYHRQRSTLHKRHLHQAV